MNEVYRACASIVVFRPSPKGAEVLLLHKPRKKDSWQLPQGGREGEETLVAAALRELKEEAGIDAELLGESDTVYQYDFPPAYRRFRPDNVRGQKIQFIFSRVPAGTEVRVDQKEIDSHAWVFPQDLSRYLLRPQYLKIIESLLKEGALLLR